MEKKKLTIQQMIDWQKQIDWQNYIERIKRGFINRFEERRALHPRRKHNCRKRTLGRIRWH